MVNVILVDFRGFDTYGEIIVLGIAALLIYALTETLLGGPVRARLLNRKPDQPRAGRHASDDDGCADRVIMPVVLMVGFTSSCAAQRTGRWVYRGLIVSIAVVMQYMASGFSGPLRVCAIRITASSAQGS